MDNLFKTIIIIALITGATFAGKHGMANYYFKQAEHQLTYLQGQKANTEQQTVESTGQESASLESISQKNNSQINLEVYNQAIGYIDDALNLHRNPQYIEAKAQTFEIAVRLNLTNNKSATLLQAKALYLESTELRPTWPVTWASLALIKWHMQEFDAEMIQYLDNAFTFGKNRVEVKNIWQQLGQALSNSSNPAHRELIKPHLNKLNYYKQK
ncbi:hypothetical protein [Thalassotalea crassostreae]|uniref:hypothetical protein n=1 Tax=Thalassotalea crassostreae TaxID=1763536 RepID=UPI0008383361|nr:hypothetical protein [Thalassotalea crassostreae]